MLGIYTLCKVKPFRLELRNLGGGDNLKTMILWLHIQHYLLVGEKIFLLFLTEYNIIEYCE